LEENFRSILRSPSLSSLDRSFTHRRINSLPSFDRSFFQDRTGSFTEHSVAGEFLKFDIQFYYMMEILVCKTFSCFLPSILDTTNLLQTDIGGWI
jgi:hypothetical protein